METWVSFFTAAHVEVFDYKECLKDTIRICLCITANKHSGI